MNSTVDRLVLVVVSFVMSGMGAPALAEPVIPSLNRFEKKKQVNRLHAGRLLAEELQCTKCHATQDATLSPKTAPTLTEVSGRVKATYLRRHIADPQSTKPGTSMPNVFRHVDAVTKELQVEALVHYLYSRGPGEPPQAYARYGASKRGQSLFHSVGCVGCHNPENQEIPGSMPLGDLPAKYTLASLSQFLMDPLHVRPSGRMPSLNLTANEAADIAAFLIPDTPEKPGMEFEYFEVRTNRLPDFSKLKAVRTGVASEFQPREHGRDRHFALRYSGGLELAAAGEYEFELGSDDGSRLLIDGTEVIDNDGVHGMQRKRGQVQLAAGRHAVVVEYFENDGQKELEVSFSGPGIKHQRLDEAMAAAAPHMPLEDLSFVAQPEKVLQGKQLFGSLGCATCHEAGSVVAANRPPAWDELREGRGCLDANSDRGVFFGLSSQQMDALNQVLAEGFAELNAERQIQHTMLQFNCVACHERGKLGGVDVKRNPFFTTTQQEMGVEGSIPPHLNGVGGKLTNDWLTRILEHGAKDRPYMLTRMPKFGRDNVGHLTHRLEQLDQLAPGQPFEIDARIAKKAGHRLVGTKGFSCIKCHTFGRFQATGVQSIDMTIMHERLREDWFRAYLKNPQAYRRGTRMPSAWPPSGPSLLPDILDGNSEKQIAAVWRYLRDGVRAKTPYGLSTSSMELIPQEEAIIYRNFIEGSGSRAIGVGYPEGVHLAFDANDLRLALIWQGAFIDASRHWNGRGQGYQPPLGEKVKSLVAGVPVAVLDSPTASWPNAPARELGYQFKGYQLSKDGRPTFFYRVADVVVEDFATPVETQTDVFLERTMRFNGDPKPHTFVRLAANVQSREGNRFLMSDGLLLTVQSSNSQPVVRESGGSEELIVPITADDTVIKLRYSW